MVRLFLRPCLSIFLGAGLLTAACAREDVIDTTDRAASDAVLFRGNLTGVPKVYLKIPEPVSSKTDWVEGGSLSIRSAEGAFLFHQDSLAVRGRGNTSWTFPKKSYALRLGRKTDLLGTGESKRYVLLANWMDRTLLRNDVAFEAARRTSLEWTPSGEFVDLFINGNPQGTYWLGEQIRIGENRLAADYLVDLDINYDDAWHFYSRIGTCFSLGRSGMPYGVKYPDDEDMTEEGLAQLQALVGRVEDALLAREGYAARIDLASFVDWYIVHELTGNAEPMHPKSTYLYFRGGKLYAGPVWDFDWHTFVPGTAGLVVRRAAYYDYLMGFDAFRQRVRKRWEELRPAFLELPEYIDARADWIRSSEAANHQRWPVYPRSQVNGDEQLPFDEAVARMKSALEERIRILNATFGAY